MTLTTEQLDALEAMLAKYRKACDTCEAELGDDEAEIEMVETEIELDRALRTNAQALLSAARERVEMRWRLIESAPNGCVTEDAGCRGVSEWFMGRPSKEYAKHMPPMVVIRRRGWPQEDRWEDAGETNYCPEFFDAWMPLPPPPGVEGDD